MLFPLAFATAATAATLDLSLSADGESFKIAVDGVEWLSGGGAVVDGSSSTDKTLVTVGAPVSASGSDKFGAYESTAVTWARSSAPTSAVMVATYKTYLGDAGMIVFNQAFPQTLGPALRDGDSTALCRIVAGDTKFALTGSIGGYTAWTPSASGYYAEHDHKYCGTTPKNTWVHTGPENVTACEDLCTSMKCACLDTKKAPSPTQTNARTVFPVFNRPTGTEKDFNCFAFHGVFPGLEDCTLSTYEDSHAGGFPLTIYDRSNTSLPSVTFSPLDFPVAQHMASTKELWGAGIKATAEVIPAGYSQSWILSAGSGGIRDGMMTWGDRVLTFTGKKRADMFKDETHATIGYWTDNGGFYHYSVGTNASLGTTYMEVLPKVKAYHDDLEVPFGHWQFDSWFYPKDAPAGGGGGGGAVTNWTNGGVGCTTDQTCFGKQGTFGMQAIQVRLHVFLFLFCSSGFSYLVVFLLFAILLFALFFCWGSRTWLSSQR
jgi:hypothetical protein